MNCILAGVGGQGTVLASKLIANAAMEKGLPVRTAETIGMAQRGGCVVSHVRIGATPDDDIASPLIPLGEADVICAFEPGEATRVLPYLGPEGKMIVATGAIRPVMASLGKSTYDAQAHLDYLQGVLQDRLVRIDTDELIAACGSAKPLNVAMLGAACASGALGIDAAEIAQALEVLVKPQFLTMNLAALELGARAYENTRKRW